MKVSPGADAILQVWQNVADLRFDVLALDCDDDLEPLLIADIVEKLDFPCKYEKSQSNEIPKKIKFRLFANIDIHFLFYAINRLEFKSAMVSQQCFSNK